MHFLPYTNMAITIHKTACPLWQFCVERIFAKLAKNLLYPLLMTGFYCLLPKLWCKSSLLIPTFVLIKLRISGKWDRFDTMSSYNTLLLYLLIDLIYGKEKSIWCWNAPWQMAFLLGDLFDYDIVVCQFTPCLDRKSVV